MDKKYFFFDIDGTLTDAKTGIVVPSAKETLRKLEENGHFVAINTGRACYKSMPVLHDLGLHNMVCYCGGGLVVNDVLVQNKPLPIDVMRDIVKECKQNHIGYCFILDDSPNYYSDDDLFLKQATYKDKAEFHIDSSFDINKIENTYKGYVAVTKQQEHLVPSLQKVGPLRYDPSFIVVQYDKKKEGIIDMMNYLHGDIKDVVTFGDDTNDVAMCDPRWFSIAVGNAVDVLKEKVDYITDTNVNDGIKKACEHFGWI